MTRINLFRFVAVLLLVALDQATKQWAISELVPGMAQPVLPWLNWTLLFNRGAAFSMLAGAGGWQWLFLSGVSVVVSGVISVLLWRLAGSQRLYAVSLILVLSGALGNLVDRLRFGQVTDFVQVHYAGWYFPAFNVADSAITVGVIGLLWLEFSNWRTAANDKK